MRTNNLIDALSHTSPITEHRAKADARSRLTAHTSTAIPGTRSRSRSGLSSSRISSNSNDVVTNISPCPEMQPWVGLAVSGTAFVTSTSDLVLVSIASKSSATGLDPYAALCDLGCQTQQPSQGHLNKPDVPRPQLSPDLGPILTTYVSTASANFSAFPSTSGNFFPSGMDTTTSKVPFYQESPNFYTTASLPHFANFGTFSGNQPEANLCSTSAVSTASASADFSTNCNNLYYNNFTANSLASTSSNFHVDP